jgi:hypothetical protein
MVKLGSTYMKIRRMSFACWITKATHTYTLIYNTWYSLLFYGNTGFMNMSQCYVMRTFPVLLLSNVRRNVTQWLRVCSVTENQDELLSYHPPGSLNMEDHKSFLQNFQLFKKLLAFMEPQSLLPLPTSRSIQNQPNYLYKPYNIFVRFNLILSSHLSLVHSDFLLNVLNISHFTNAYYMGRPFYLL